MAGADRAAVRGGPPSGRSSARKSPVQGESDVPKTQPPAGTDRNAADLPVPSLSDTTVAGLVAQWRERLLAVDATGTPDQQAAHQAFIDIFVRGGDEALRASIRRGRWVQLSLAPAGAAFDPALFSRLKRLTATLLSDDEIENFFFMFKQPGLRLRFEASRTAPELTRRIESEIAQWCGDGLTSRGSFGVYEPEAELFGGPRSMRHVEAIFTLDSLVWLEFHGQGEGRRASGTNAWPVSFALLRALYDGLGIVGWEDLGVFAHIRDRLGRRLPAVTAGQLERTALESDVVALWEEAAGSADRPAPSPAPGSALANRREAIRSAARQWKTGYFDTPDAWIGPRQAAAYATIFHWNRANLSAPQQALIAEALAGRRATEDTR